MSVPTVGRGGRETKEYTRRKNDFITLYEAMQLVDRGLEAYHRQMMERRWHRRLIRWAKGLVGR